MKKITLLILMLIPIKINAETLTTTINCPEKAKPETIISCTITTTATSPLNGLKLNHNLDNNLTYQKTSINNNWKTYYKDKNGLAITKLNNTEKEIINIELYFKTPKLNTTNNTYTINLTNIEASNNNYDLLTSSNISKQITVVSDDNSLSNLTITNASLTSNFNKNKLDYEGTTNDNNITINATPTDKNAKVTGHTGNQTANYGSNIYTITVTSPLGNIRNYTITIIRQLPKSKNSEETNPTLKNIEIEGSSINFKQDKYNYEIEVPNNQTTIDLSALPFAKDSKVEIDKPDYLKEGNNIITITVTAKDGTVCKYTINVIRKKLSSDTTIKKIIIDNYKLNIKENIYNYELKIKKENKLNIKVILNDDKATYTIEGNKDLKTGSIITIKVTAEDKTTEEYNIEIIKEKISDKNLLENKRLLIITSILLILTSSIALIGKRIKK